MAIGIVELYGVTCDNCGAPYQDEETGFMAWNDPEDAKMAVHSERCDWLIYGDKHYCDYCIETYGKTYDSEVYKALNQD